VNREAERRRDDKAEDKRLHRYVLLEKEQRLEAESLHHPPARAVWHYRAIVLTRSQAYSQHSFYPVSRENGSGQAASGRFIFGPDVPVTAFSQELSTAKTVLMNSSCPLQDADPPPPHHFNDDPGARLLFRSRPYRR
jgi:hypothetical protein